MKSTNGKVKKPEFRIKDPHIMEEVNISNLKVQLAAMKEEHELRHKLMLPNARKEICSAEAKKAIYESEESKDFQFKSEEVSNKDKLRNLNLSMIQTDHSDIRGCLQFRADSEYNNNHEACTDPAQINQGGPQKQKSSGVILDKIRKCNTHINPEAKDWVIAKHRMPPDPFLEQTPGGSVSEQTALERYLTALQLPQRKFQKFTGNVLEYKAFRRAFEVRVNCRAVTDVEKLDYLLQFVKGESKELIDDCKILSELLGATAAYKEARARLDKEYGNQGRPTALYESTLMNWHSIHTDDAMELKKFSAYMGKCLNAMSLYDELACLNQRRYLQELQEKLPTWLQNGWCDHASMVSLQEGRKLKFTDFADFVQQAAVSSN